MSMLPFDTQAYCEKMIAFGISPETAKALTNAFKAAIGEDIVTKTHLKRALRAMELRTRLFETFWFALVILLICHFAR